MNISSLFTDNYNTWIHVPFKNNDCMKPTPKKGPLDHPKENRNWFDQQISAAPSERLRFFKITLLKIKSKKHDDWHLLWYINFTTLYFKILWLRLSNWLHTKLMEWFTINISRSPRSLYYAWRLCLRYIQLFWV